MLVIVWIQKATPNTVCRADTGLPAPVYANATTLSWSLAHRVPERVTSLPEMPINAQIRTLGVRRDGKFHELICEHADRIFGDSQPHSTWPRVLV